MISEYLDKNNLHHAYLIEGAREEIVPEIIKFLKDLGIKTAGNPDFYHITIDNFKIDEAFDLRAMSVNKSFTVAKKVFLICVNSFSLDAQNVLLKMFEEPIENTHFFLVVPDMNILIKTLVSRFYLIRTKTDLEKEYQDAEKFITLPFKSRIDFIKELLTEEDAVPTKVGIPTEVGKDLSLDSNRAKALKFLNALEFVLHKKMSRTVLDTGVNFFEHFFKVREFLRMPGSSTKSLMESIALVTPSF